MSVLLDFPLRVLVPSDPALTPEYLTQPGHEATNGMRRSVGLAAGRFRLMLGGILIDHDSDQHRTLMALAANLQGDRNLCRVRLPDLYGIDGPWAMATQPARNAHPGGIPFATAVMYKTGVGHAVPTLDAVFLEDRADGESFVIVAADAELPGGTSVSVNDFCHVVAGSWTEPDGRNLVKLSPPLHLPVQAGDVMSLAPVFVGYCVTPTPAYAPRRHGRFSTVSFEFVEDLTRLVREID